MWRGQGNEEKRGRRAGGGGEERGGEGRGGEGRRVMTNVPHIPDSSPNRQSSSRGRLAGPLNLNVGVGGLSDEEEVAAVLAHHCREHRPWNGHLLGSVGRRQ